MCHTGRRRQRYWTKMENPSRKNHEMLKAVLRGKQAGLPTLSLWSRLTAHQVPRGNIKHFTTKTQELAMDSSTKAKRIHQLVFKRPTYLTTALTTVGKWLMRNSWKSRPEKGSSGKREAWTELIKEDRCQDKWDKTALIIPKFKIITQLTSIWMSLDPLNDFVVKKWTRWIRWQPPDIQLKAGKAMLLCPRRTSEHSEVLVLARMR